MFLAKNGIDLATAKLGAALSIISPNNRWLAEIGRSRVKQDQDDHDWPKQANKTKPNALSLRRVAAARNLVAVGDVSSWSI